VRSYRKPYEIYDIEIDAKNVDCTQERNEPRSIAISVTFIHVIEIYQPICVTKCLTLKMRSPVRINRDVWRSAPLPVSPRLADIVRVNRHVSNGARSGLMRRTYWRRHYTTSLVRANQACRRLCMRANYLNLVAYFPAISLICSLVSFLARYREDYRFREKRHLGRSASPSRAEAVLDRDF
jgi:hypothetical protein